MSRIFEATMQFAEFAPEMLIGKVSGDDSTHCEDSHEFLPVGGTSDSVGSSSSIPSIKLL